MRAVSRAVSRAVGCAVDGLGMPIVAGAAVCG